MSQEPITIVDYSPAWPAQYAAEVRRIRASVGEYVTAIEHIGSTAVPGLGATPIIDVMVGVERLADAETCIESLTDLGYEYCPEFEDAMPYRRYFRKTTAEAHTHHLHMVETASEFWERHRLFRDYLRDHPAVAQQYEALKRELAEAYRHDVERYGAGKSRFIEAIEERARDHYGQH